VSGGSRNLLWKVLVFAAAVEMGTGVAFIVDPTIIVRLLLGAEVAGVGIPLGRCFGIALLALAIACWPSRDPAARRRPALRAMLVYNALIAAFLAWLGIAAHMGGILLWPAAVLHAAVALVLVWAYRDTSSTYRAQK
jgi:Ca2+/Na+ antiporter